MISWDILKSMPTNTCIKILDKNRWVIKAHLDLASFIFKFLQSAPEDEDEDEAEVGSKFLENHVSLVWYWKTWIRADNRIKSNTFRLCAFNNCTINSPAKDNFIQESCPKKSDRIWTFFGCALPIIVWFTHLKKKTFLNNCVPKWDYPIWTFLAVRLL